jgi:uncharacterized protein (DUF2062 family)
MRTIPTAAKRNLALWLRQGISPSRLALTLALGFAIGCIPLLGTPTILCIALAVGLRLNFPVIQAANCIATPLQLILIVPFMRMGNWLLMAAGPAHQPVFHAMPSIVAEIGGLAGQAFLAWLLVAIPTVALLTAALTRMLRRIPDVNAAKAE